MTRPMATLGDILKAAIEEGARQPGRDDDVTGHILRDALAGWNKRCPFKPGDIVRPAKHSSFWKTSLGPCIVLRFDVGEHITHESGSVLSWDMRLIAAGEQGGCREVLGHSRDFELVPGV